MLWSSWRPNVLQSLQMANIERTENIFGPVHKQTWLIPRFTIPVLFILSDRTASAALEQANCQTHETASCNKISGHHLQETVLKIVAMGNEFHETHASSFSTFSWHGKLCKGKLSWKIHSLWCKSGGVCWNSCEPLEMLGVCCEWQRENTEKWFYWNNTDMYQTFETLAVHQDLWSPFLNLNKFYPGNCYQQSTLSQIELARQLWDAHQNGTSSQNIAQCLWM